MGFRTPGLHEGFGSRTFLLYRPIPIGETIMNFDIEGILDSAKEKVVEAATEKFGASATPIAEEVAGKMEEVVAGKMGVPLHGDTSPADTNG